jgi:Uma2 family endonuclease
MATKPKTNLTVEQYLEAYEGEPAGRYELVDGNVITMAAETVRHVRAKGQAFSALREAVKKSGLPCEVFTDGVSVRTDKQTVREPDVSVQCSKPTDPDSMLIDEPIILVEVISPSSEFRDVHRKLVEYFSLPSVQHYLVVDQAKRLVFHNTRDPRGGVFTQFFYEGSIDMKPPGLSVAVSDLLGAA